MHSGKRDLPYTSSHFPAKPSEFLPFSSWDAPSSGEKVGNRRKRATPLSPCSTGGTSQQTPRTPWLRQDHFSLQKAVLDVMLPYGFAAMMGLSQTLPAERCRLWLKESISTPTTKFSQWCSQQRQTGEPGLDTLAQAQCCSFSFCHLEILPPIIHWSWLVCYNKLPNSTP